MILESFNNIELALSYGYCLALILDKNLKIIDKPLGKLETIFLSNNIVLVCLFHHREQKFLFRNKACFFHKTYKSNAIEVYNVDFIREVLLKLEKKTGCFFKNLEKHVEVIVSRKIPFFHNSALFNLLSQQEEYEHVSYKTMQTENKNVISEYYKGLFALAKDMHPTVNILSSDISFKIKHKLVQQVLKLI